MNIIIFFTSLHYQNLKLYTYTELHLVISVITYILCCSGPKNTSGVHRYARPIVTGKNKL